LKCTIFIERGRIVISLSRIKMNVTKRPDLFKRHETKTAWGLDVSGNELKAVRITKAHGETTVDAVDIIEHSDFSAGFDIQEPQQIKNAMHDFVQKHSFGRSTELIVSIPGQLTMSRFSTIPPVSKKQLKDIVRYEAQQQIPFNLNKIIWDYHQLSGRVPLEEGIEIGFFASKRETVDSIIKNIASHEINITALQVSPLAVYNFVLYDQKIENTTIILHREAKNTNLIIIDGSHFWLRNIPLHDINANFIKEIQRSMEYYKSLSKETAQFKTLLLLGTEFQDQLKQKFIQDNFAFHVKTLDTLHNLKLSPKINTDFFYNNSMKLSVALGLALQGVGLSKIDTNLLPPELVRLAEISKIKPYAITTLGCCALFLIVQHFGLHMQMNQLGNLYEQNHITLQKIKGLERKYKNAASAAKIKKEKLEVVSSIDPSRFFWMEVFKNLLSLVPDKISISSIHSSWINPDTLNTDTKEKKNSSKKWLLMGIKGESKEPSIEFIEQNVLSPIKKLTLFDQKTPAFKNVEIVPGSCRQVYSEDYSATYIEFEIRWFVKSSEGLSNDKNDNL